MTRIDTALRKSAAFLVAQQGEDGGFHSAAYAAFRDGRATTPLTLSALLFAPASSVPAPMYDRGVDFAASLVSNDGAVVHTDYAVYAAALTSLVLSVPRNARYAQKRVALVAFLRARQLSAHNGWHRDDLAFGGWGYWPDVPTRPHGAIEHELLSSNISATLFAVGALAMAGVQSSDAAMQDALVFVDRCRAKDGGYFLTPTNDVQNKAAKHDDGAYRAYGSATADALRLLLRLGVPRADARVEGAVQWLARHVHGPQQAGDFPPDRAFARHGSRFYAAWTIAHALLLTGAPRSWAETFADELIAAQRADGSFANDATDLREDDPLIATPLAMSALALARSALSGSRPTSMSMEPPLK